MGSENGNGEAAVTKIVGVFVGEWVDGRIFAVYHGAGGYEYLASGDADSRWNIVSVKDPQGDEHELEEPVLAPHPVAVMQGLIRGSDEFSLALDEWREGEKGDGEE